MRLTNYQPRSADVIWARQLLGSMADGGIWGIPRCQMLFKIDHQKKQLVQIGGPTEGEDYLNEIDCNTAVFAEAGYQLIPLGEALTPSRKLHWTQFSKKDLS